MAKSDRSKKLLLLFFFRVMHALPVCVTFQNFAPSLIPHRFHWVFCTGVFCAVPRLCVTSRVRTLLAACLRCVHWDCYCFARSSRLYSPPCPRRLLRNTAAHCMRTA